MEMTVLSSLCSDQYKQYVGSNHNTKNALKKARKNTQNLRLCLLGKHGIIAHVPWVKELIKTLELYYPMIQF